MASLTIEGLWGTVPGNRRDEAIVVRGVSCVVPDGGVLAVLGAPYAAGAAGAGQGALLRLIAGLGRIEAGTVRLDAGNDAPAHGIILVPREPALPGRTTVRAAVAGATGGDGGRIDTLLGTLGLDRVEAVRLDALTTADRCRAAVARALAARPAVLLLDDPVGGLDESEQRLLRMQLREALRLDRTTALLATTDVRDASAVADTVLVLGSGRVLQRGAVRDVLTHPASSEVAALTGWVLLLAGSIEGRAVVEPGVGVVPVPPGTPVADRARVMAHPSSMLAVPPGRGLGCGVQATVVAALPDGPLHRLELTAGGRMFEARWEWDEAAPPPGATVELAVQPGSLRFFEEPGGLAMRAPDAGAGRMER